ncbi:RNA polymerase subunit sigma-24 [Sphingopyxis sp. H038]|uniref:RNA polymerase sigma factor n=1 Tax=unclassified Sphingopyxis TaxID=2614943 RepID=UPI00072FF7CC|nr:MULTISPECIES: RNA polymerase sigma factor [unclassified Sphingopyxis]KTE03640.1 RNA polymerase subunit sigma-24 [Sphingopyxis sp. H012]KTE04764.1 RNA polymerase subunit sigma-24 [Sphingopyxis sp. H093]KTE09098.1 RNA polymerase subunit sigma-24 [Sphingopyxis sp. H053]KTE24992.1 RNA polymerase subunit sigma-24 [Sphingopyxis sp. H080]KTE29788.1 RNA polymerase subunit sigma-24 [Sphingopyxis sp. H038]
MSLDLSQCSDRELAALARAGQQQVYRELLRRYKAPVFRLIQSNIGDPDEAMDLTQETFVAGFGAIGRYDADRPFRIWIARIALNKCRDWARRRTVRSFFARALPLESAHDVASDGPAPDAEAADRAELARVRAAMARLPSNLREVLVLRGVEDLTQAETAELLQTSEKTVEMRLYRARAKLKTLLGEPASRMPG